MTPQTRSKLLCWALVLVISVGVCLYSILDKWHKFETSPVIISFAKTTTPIWQVPFPAVTVCSYLKSRATVFNYTRVWHQWNKYHNLTAEDQKKFDAVSLVCNLKQDFPGNYTTDIDAVDILKEVGPQMNDTFTYARWRNKERWTHDLFTPIVMDGGICYTFNMLSTQQFYTTHTVHEDNHVYKGSNEVKGWSLDDGYSKDAGLDPYPYRGWGVSDRNGLIIVMDVLDVDRDYVCKGPHQGFKVFVHNPAEIPNRNSKATVLALNQDTTISVKPSMMTTSEDLEEYSAERRQCHYPSSRRLKFFSVYTQSNCHMECATNYTLYMCECVAFHMPRDEKTPVCGALNTDCVDYALAELPKKEILGQLQVALSDSNATLDVFDYKKCDCLPTCTELQYDTKISRTAFNWKAVYDGYDETTKPGLNKVRANIYFEDMQFFTSHRSELYGRTDFLASCGGLLGLFMGFSILSLVEIVYFFTIRACCNVYKNQRVKIDEEVKTGDVELSLQTEETKVPKLT